MSKGTVNKAIMIGRLGNDPETRFTPTGVACTTFTIATNESWKDDDGKEKVQTDWHHVVAWRKLGEICQQYLKKGSQVFIEGKIRTRSWEKDNVKRYTTEIIAEHVQFLGHKQESEGRTFTPPIAEESTPAVTGPVSSDDLPF
jgi:single-strand DNA-binding protein